MALTAGVLAGKLLKWSSGLGRPPPIGRFVVVCGAGRGVWGPSLSSRNKEKRQRGCDEENGTSSGIPTAKQFSCRRTMMLIAVHSFH
jgi:hypothetical protein